MTNYSPPIRHLDRDVYELACERTSQVFDSFDHVGVMFSGGKDSTAVVQVALEVLASDPTRWRRHTPLRVVFWDEEAIPYETEQYVRRMSQRDDVSLEWLCVPVKHRNACSVKTPWWWPWAPESEDVWCRPMPPEAVTTLPGFPVWPPAARLSAPDAQGLLAPPQRGNTALLMGIRAQESMHRRRSVTTQAANREHNYLVKFDKGTSAGNLWKAYPIYDWTTADVWTAPARFGWDYNRAYDRMEMAGLPHHTQRCSPAFGEEPLEKLWTYAQCFPEVWEKMVDRVPGVGAAARYARTELYGYRDVPEKPDGMTWPEFVNHFTGRHSGQDRAMLAGNMRELVRRHYRKTTMPILPHNRHPLTGMSWEFAIRMALRGDFKSRRAAAVGASMHAAAAGRSWRRYADELASILAAGRFAELGHPGPPPRDPHQLIPPEHREERP